MAKKQSKTARKDALPALNLYTDIATRRRRALILPRNLHDEADKILYQGKDQNKAHEILVKWADLESKGHLRKKETAVDADFLLEVFGEALRFNPASKSPSKYYLERNFTVPGIGTADGALGVFGAETANAAVAVIELKDIGTDLDRDRFNGRTPVQQCWDYLNALPDCPWGIVSNFATFRLYHRNKTPLAYQEFRLKDLRDINVFRQFWCLFDLAGLLPSIYGEPRALKLLQQSETRQREVSDQLYESYSSQRYRLIQHLHFERNKPVDTAIRIAQKIIDRIIFIAFCEDRSLLPEGSIKKAWSSVPPFTKVTNPRWQSFLALFHFVDQGHASLGLDRGYNGGLFRHDPEVDDLQLSDDWTNFFNSVGEYDFRDEVNVEVLGHLFERSIGDLEKLRSVGFFELRPAANGDVEPAMPKSPERKRLGIYYTPVEFTSFIVAKSVGALIDERWLSLRKELAIASEEADQPTPALAQYWRRCLEDLRQLRICDPACGSGAFLIQAYDLLDAKYHHVIEQLCFHEGPSAEPLHQQVAEWILHDNLFGVDLSEQAVEITQLALWIRSARRGQTLADLSQNIRHGNSLIADPAIDPKALRWRDVFPAVFARDETGFDCVIGNPPWERLKLQEREFFAFSAPKIAGAVSAAQRRKLVGDLESKNPELFQRYERAKQQADRTLLYARDSDAFPLTAKGDINTYMLFAELARSLVAPHGRVGLLLPSGIATDHTTREFFNVMMDNKSLILFHDFENKAPYFPDVHRAFKFCVLVFGGGSVQTEQADFVFFAHRIEELAEQHRHIPLSAKDIARVNPNTRTCPIFRTRRDADLTRSVYERVPILVDHNRAEGGNPWGVKFVTMFHQTNDAELFRTAEELKTDGCRRDGNRWRKGKQTYLPLYEAKMVQAYDHRAASVVLAEANWVRQGQTEATTLVDHQNPEFVVLPRWWVDEVPVVKQLGNPRPQGFLGFKDITSPTNERTMIAAYIPWVAVTNHFPLLLTDQDQRLETCLLANLNSFVLDYIARQKIGGVTLNFFIVEQLPVFPPDHYEQPCPWNKRKKLVDWIAERVLKLSCTANDLKPLAEAAGADRPVYKWREAERTTLLAELDAAYFHLYGLGRDDVEYVLQTFGPRGEAVEGSVRSQQVEGILEAYERQTN